MWLQYELSSLAEVSQYYKSLHLPLTTTLTSHGVPEHRKSPTHSARHHSQCFITFSALSKQMQPFPKTRSPATATHCFRPARSNIFSFPYRHPVAAYVFFLAFPSLAYLLQPRVLEGNSYARSNHSNSSSFVLLYVGSSSSPWLYLTLLSFVTRCVQMISILLEHHISKLSRHLWFIFRNSKVSAPY